MKIKQKILLLETLALLIIILLLWMDEMLDLPHLLWNADPTLFNWKEAVIETIVIVVIIVPIIVFTWHNLKKIKRLESILPICSVCKKIRNEEGYWQQVEEYIQKHAGYQFSHSLCHDCAEKLYGGQEWYEKMKMENQKAQ
ncbi:MAG: hypothetical protein JXQ65_02600 [Candidatus Marinimicrobia bacterium]|nr:hypothetical protein [Candidatus Neomarinimicrobiota bacterium]